MTRSAVSIDSTWDDNTALASNFRRSQVFPYLEARQIDVTELDGPSANQAAAQAAIQQVGVSYITGVSHGLNDTFTGDQNRPVFQTGIFPPGMFRGKLVHFLACSTAFFLGRNLVRPNGARAFFGYNDMFMWPHDDENKYANMFFDCDAEIDRALADGSSAGVAAQRAIAKYDAQIAALRQSGDSSDLLIAAALERNRDLLRTPMSSSDYGDLAATL